MRLMERVLLGLSRRPAASDYQSGGTASALTGALRQLSDPFPQFVTLIQNEEVLDFGCGRGFQAVAMALHGARHVVGVDIIAKGLENGRRVAADAGVSDRVDFSDNIDATNQGRFGFVVSLNSMEHFGDPQGMLSLMTDLLRPGGRLVITFSPPWYAPYGSHMYAFTRIPWVHLLFSERTVMAVRGHFRKDGASKYEEVEGGLNRMTVRRFSHLVRRSGLNVIYWRCDPIKKLRALGLLTKTPIVREFFANRISCILEKPG